MEKPLVRAVFFTVLLIIPLSVDSLAFAAPKAPTKQAAPVPAPEPEPQEPPPQEIFFGLAANLDIVHINLSTRKVQLGFTPGVGFGVRWAPPWWTLTRSLISVDALLGASFANLDEADDFDYFQISAVPVVSLAGFLSVGLGVSLNLALKPGAKDTLEYVFSFGLSAPVSVDS